LSSELRWIGSVSFLGGLIGRWIEKGLFHDSEFVWVKLFSSSKYSSVVVVGGGGGGVGGGATYGWWVDYNDIRDIKFIS
jgi:hypothetical protein